MPDTPRCPACAGTGRLWRFLGFSSSRWASRGRYAVWCPDCMGTGERRDVLEVDEIRATAVRLAQELDVHVDRAEAAIRSLLAKGLIERRGRNREALA